MKIKILKSKLHRVIVTDTHLDYEGSCAIDENLLDAAKINEFEMIHIYNLSNGKRFTTYALKAEKNTGIISLNGAASYQGKINDLLIICSYAEIEDELAMKHKPVLVYFENNTNKIQSTKSMIKTQKKVKLININK